eukprot:1727933-Rhodomonas_salina.1
MPLPQRAHKSGKAVAQMQRALDVKTRRGPRLAEACGCRPASASASASACAAIASALAPKHVRAQHGPSVRVAVNAVSTPQNSRTSAVKAAPPPSTAQHRPRPG